MCVRISAGINTGMRAWELYEQGDGDPRTPDDRRTRVTRKPVVGLRHINRLKRAKAEQESENEQRQRLWSVMYADANAERNHPPRAVFRLTG